MKYLDFTDLGSFDYFYNKYSSKIRKVSSFNEYYNYGFPLANPLGSALSQLLPVNLFKMWGNEEPWVKDVPHKHDYYVTPEIKRNRN